MQAPPKPCHTPQRPLPGLSSTQLVIHLSRNPPAGGSQCCCSLRHAAPAGSSPARVPHKPQRWFPRSQPPPLDATDTCVGSARGLTARAGGAVTWRGAPMHCTSCQISSLGYVGEPCLICCNIPIAIGGLQSFLPVMASS